MPIRVDIVSDVVCPWCAVGYYQLARAAETTGISVEVTWHPFELNPAMPPEGENLRAHLAAKYGTTEEASRAVRARLTALGADLGFTFDFAPDMRIVNTFRAHQLIDWAGEAGKAHAVKLALFGAYFTLGENIDDPNLLATVAAAVGLDAGEAFRMLETGERRAAVREAERFWTAQGITGVPAMVFERRHLVSGAQGEETYARILRLLAGAGTEATEAP